MAQYGCLIIKLILSGLDYSIGFQSNCDRSTHEGKVTLSQFNFLALAQFPWRNFLHFGWSGLVWSLELQLYGTINATMQTDVKSV